MDLRRLGGAPEVAAQDAQRLIRVGRSMLNALLTKVGGRHAALQRTMIIITSRLSKLCRHWCATQ